MGIISAEKKKRLTFNCISWFHSYLMTDKIHQKHTKLTIYTKLIHRQFQWINCELIFVFIAVSCVAKHNIIFDRCQFYYRWNDYKFILLSEIRWQLTNYEHFYRPFHTLSSKYENYIIFFPVCTRCIYCTSSQ